jgi:hypothetical protein
LTEILNEQAGRQTDNAGRLKEILDGHAKRQTDKSRMTGISDGQTGG